MTDGRRIRVGVVGIGVIGKRVAAAAVRQPDMELVGLAVRSLSPNVVYASKSGWALFASHPTFSETSAAHGIQVDGSLLDLAERCDVVVDCGQRGTGLGRAETYDRAGVKTVFCGGEQPGMADTEFSTFVTYPQTRDASTTRLSSCNVTGIARLLPALQEGGLLRLDATAIRCATDPDKASKGVVSSAHVAPGPSRQSEELRHLFPGLRTHIHAVTVPMYSGHVITLSATVSDPDAAAVSLNDSPRVDVGDFPRDTYDLAHDIDGEAVERHGIAVWRDSLWTERDKLHLQAHVHMEAITIPDAIDAIRALADSPLDAGSSATETDRSLGFLPPDCRYSLARGRRFRVVPEREPSRTSAGGAV